MTSPARRHLHRALAGQSATAGSPARVRAIEMPQTGAAASEYQKLLAALGIDLNQLRGIQSTERKIEAKRTMIGTYRAWIEGAADAWGETGGAAGQDEIVSTTLVWAIDIQDWPLALKLARYVIAAGIQLPSRYNRTVPTLVAEEVAEIGIAVPGAVPFDVLNAVADLVEDQDIFDQVRAKLEKALGLAFKTRADAFDPHAESAVAGGRPALLTAAVTHLERALALDAKCGVKKLVQAIQAEMKKLSAEPPA